MINKTFTHRRIRNRGFTLVETLVAVFILMISITGPLTVAQRGFTTAVVAKDQVTAFYLAQDALEFVRFARDTNRLFGSDWLQGNGNPNNTINLNICTGSSGCYFDTTEFDDPSACGSACPYLKYDETTKKYQYGTGNDTIFRRTVKILSVPSNINGDEVIAGTTVTWVGTNGVERSATLYENIFDWQ